MGAREDILKALRDAAPPQAPLPEPFEGVQYPDLREQFARSVAGVGGRCVFVTGDLRAELLRIPEFAAAYKVVSWIPEIGSVDLTAVQEPHDLQDVEFCVLRAELGVAENGACWITYDGRVNRAVSFLAQHIAIVVKASTLVHNLHEAYARIEMPRRGFAMFLSGPSKTADIEQALVMGAQGPRSCTVFVTDD